MPGSLRHPGEPASSTLDEREERTDDAPFAVQEAL
jgi:hypothetical protein